MFQCPAQGIVHPKKKFVKKENKPDRNTKGKKKVRQKVYLNIHEKRKSKQNRNTLSTCYIMIMTITVIFSNSLFTNQIIKFVSKPPDTVFN